MSVGVATGATVSSTSVNSNINVYGGTSSGVYAGVKFTFDPAVVQYSGRTGPGNGGTTAIATGDSLFTGFTEMIGNYAGYTPIAINNRTKRFIQRDLRTIF